MAKIDFDKEYEGLEKAIQRFSEYESGDAYQAFLTYAFLSGKDRTIERCAEMMGYEKRTIAGWYGSYQWKERADQVDAQRWLRDFRIREQETAKDNRHFIDENRKIKREAIKISQKMLNVASNLLDSAELAGKVIETGEVETIDGRFVKTKTEIHMKAKISDIPRLADVGVKLARAANDLPTEPIDPTIAPTSNLQSLSKEELERMREDNRDILIKHGAVQKLDGLQ